MATIREIKAREIYDSRGNPTVEVTVILDNGKMAKASVPSGASTGAHEAHELRDADGFGVKKAVANVEEISNALKGNEIGNLWEIDKAMMMLDGTENKSRLGANAILGVSLAAARAAALDKGMPLYRFLQKYFEFNEDYVAPKPLLNIINGGAHADNNVDVQEMMVVPVMGNNFTKRIEAGAKIYKSLKEVLRSRGLATMIGDEGGFAPNLENNEAGMVLLVEAIEKAGYIPGKDVFIALDVAATELYKETDGQGGYYYIKSQGVSLKAPQMTGMYFQWIVDYPIFSIEDPLAEDDFEGWANLKERLEKVDGRKIQIIGDDLFVTNPARIKDGISKKLANGAIIKYNQIGTLTETVEAIKMLTKAKFQPIISHRSGETTDDFIADLVVACGCGQIKSGAPARGERVAKYNRLLEIEAEIKS
ncbi:TPA: phosphopyruvate hydratase [candidate division CPR2 bacterium]|uniref:Enolase n=1 Tax=candidate division CPR2 bacterium GW2011_GWC1_41_48 TaxID=1618344 RepID=A0A0G0Z7X0_UNCC2|nr:MAG: Enolase [candidate division CPR2 bacterium GW2011_GWC2_39_35]KKR27202.1 MAG: Enolase [candidate division CPR2 bacterium GW2011_GWD1_39_7]KKR27430.1 MAG: Enolase [candidate division CPR2 bacterium GW2011_GWD2_39_7]KKS09108.1 MAG: Enolase [candidate division CPR2 bacterium GW2011_GWC1_41_48]OGB57383.1 MAG: phosphopyruvate hydratase [candidate division CPR2 bacterium GWD1_39_7]OGB71081.1 MAG: phosphopyruvate hydratase [candidate division CPR2 bacterium GWD2_39_7]HBG81819.1 phosphopyruvat